MHFANLMRPRWLVTVVALGLGACGAADPGTGDQANGPDGRLTGAVLYRERIALPPDATVTVQLQDVSRADAAADVLAEQTIAAAGKQVPIPFELRYFTARIEPTHRYAVRAEIRDGAKTLLFTTTTQHSVTLDRGSPPMPVDVLVQQPSREPAADAAPPPGRTFVFDCGGDVTFIVRTGPDEVALWLPIALGSRYLVLAQTPAGSGARFQEGDTVFWSRGELATFEAQGQRFVDCKSNPAKVPWADAERRGVTLRALGNEPAWTFEVQGRDRLIVTTDLGATKAELPWSPPTVAGARTTYHAVANGHELTAVVDGMACVDTMSGDGFEAAVTVTLDGKTLRGCGRFL